MIFAVTSGSATGGSDFSGGSAVSLFGRVAGGRFVPFGGGG